MRLGILTQPLHTNYGGLIQAWALQHVLMEMGHDTWIIQREFKRLKDFPVCKRLMTSSKRFFLGLLNIDRNLRPSSTQLEVIRKNTSAFVENRIHPKTPYIYTDIALKRYIQNSSFEGYVVGSDQVWRPKYSPNIDNYFLDFVENDIKIKRISYAASLGVDVWEFDERDTKTVQRLAPKFNLITVREVSAIELLREKAGVDAKIVVDPTLLIKKELYEDLVKNPTCPLRPSSGNLFCYVLDSNPIVNQVIENCTKDTLFRPFYCNSNRKLRVKGDEKYLDECVMPPVEQWIKSFIDAKMVITDSFHGTVFSIIFNKPFWVVVNKERGSSRFLSLLKIFDLEDRMISLDSTPDWNTPINWDKVNNRRELFANESYSLLSESLI